LVATDWLWMLASCCILLMFFSSAAMREFASASAFSEASLSSASASLSRLIPVFV
jgi:hypothetical protein